MCVSFEVILNCLVFEDLFCVFQCLSSGTTMDLSVFVTTSTPQCRVGVSSECLSHISMTRVCVCVCACIRACVCVLCVRVFCGFFFVCVHRLLTPLTVCM